MAARRSAGFGFRDGVRGRRGQGGGVLPLRQFLPDFQRLVGGRRVGPAEGMGDVAAPAPAGFLHPRRQHGGIPVQQRVAALGQLVQQCGGKVGQPGDLGFQADRRLVVVQRHAPGRAAWARRCGRGGRRRTGPAGRRRDRGACPGGGTWRGRGPGSAAAGCGEDQRPRRWATTGVRRPVSGWRRDHGPRPRRVRRAARWKVSHLSV